MKATKIAVFVLMCVMVLACATTIGLALLPNFALEVQSWISHESSKLPTTTRLIHPMGDPIDDPKPNKH